MSNLARNTTTGTNSARSGIINASHIWDEENTPWSPDNTLPWQDNETRPEFNISGTPIARSAVPVGANLTRN